MTLMSSSGSGRCVIVGVGCGVCDGGVLEGVSLWVWDVHMGM